MHVCTCRGVRDRSVWCCEGAAWHYGCGCARHDVFVCARCRLYASACAASVRTRGRAWSRDSERRVVTAVLVLVQLRGASTFSVWQCVDGCSWWRLWWLRVRWLCVTSLNVSTSRSGGLASVPFRMYSLLCARRRRDVARARARALTFACGFRVVNVCIRLNRCRVRVFGGILMGIRLAFAYGAAEAFPAS